MKAINEMAVTKLPDYYNKRFRNRLKEIAGIIFDASSKEFSQNTKEAYIIDNGVRIQTAKKYFMLEFDDFKVDWIKKLNVLISFDNQLDGSSTGNDYYTLAHHFAYKVSFITNHGKITDVALNRMPQKFNLDVDGKEFPPQVIRNGVAEVATVVFEMPQEVKESKIEFILYHELTHIWQLSKNQGNMEQITKAENVVRSIKAPITDYDAALKETKYVQILFDEELLLQFKDHSKKEKIDAVRHIGQQGIFHVLYQIAYYLNPYEIDAHLSNICEEISNHGYSEMKNLEDREAVTTLSNIAYKFNAIADTLEIIEQFASKQIQRQFAHTYMDHLYSDYFGDDIKYIFNKDYKNEVGVCDENSFNEFIYDRIDSIDEMLDEAVDIFNEILEEKRKKLGLTFEQLITQNYNSKRFHNKTSKTSWLLMYYNMH